MNTAVKEFSAAAQLDPHFFEAQMNLAAINLSFRGYDKAEAAYRKALEMHPNDYDAHLGLALALRGQIDDSNYDKQVAAVQSELDTCKKLDGARPDAYFNEGILTQEYKAKSSGDTDEGRGGLRPGQAGLPDLPRQGVGQDRVRRRRQEDEGAHAGHRRHGHLPPGGRAEHACGARASCPCGGGRGAGRCGLRGAGCRAGASAQRPARAAPGEASAPARESPRQQAVLLKPFRRGRVPALRDVVVTMNRLTRGL